jgi:hypothetical protein
MDRLPLTDVQSKLSELVLQVPAPGKHCCRSAISHIERAWTLRHMDKEMAVFRAITGEEESVSAIFHSLKRIGYVGADRLKPRDHVHKAALHPFLQAVKSNLAQARLDQLKPTLELNLDGKPAKFQVRLSLPQESGRHLHMYPVPPLNFTLKQNEKLYNFVKEILQVTKQQTLNTVIDHVRSIANRRNQVLYASQEGIPRVRELPDKFLITRRDRIFGNITLFLLIDPHPVQSFVQQALDAFLAMLRLLPKELEGETN